VRLRTALDSSKDYVLLEDVLDMLPKILVEGRQNIYNIAAGQDITHREIVTALGCGVDVVPNAPRVTFPSISIARLKQEFNYMPSAVLPVIAAATLSRQTSPI